MAATIMTDDGRLMLAPQQVSLAEVMSYYEGQILKLKEKIKELTGKLIAESDNDQISREEAVKILGCDKVTFWRKYLKTDIIKPVSKVGRYHLYRRGDIKALAEQSINE